MSTRIIDGENFSRRNYVIFDLFFLRLLSALIENWIRQNEFYFRQTTEVRVARAGKSPDKIFSLSLHSGFLIFNKIIPAVQNVRN